MWDVGGSCDSIRTGATFVCRTCGVPGTVLEQRQHLRGGQGGGRGSRDSFRTGALFVGWTMDMGTR